MTLTDPGEKPVNAQAAGDPFLELLGLRMISPASCRVPDNTVRRRPAATQHERPPMQPGASKRPVVLVVEDEILVRMDAIDAIETAGFDVIDARDADEAISILERRNDVRLIFTDIQMPGSMDGLKLAHFVRDRWPPIKIIATSGHAKITERDLPEGSRFLPKPYAVAQIASAIGQLVRP